MPEVALFVKVHPLANDKTLAVPPPFPIKKVFVPLKLLLNVKVFAPMAADKVPAVGIVMMELSIITSFAVEGTPLGLQLPDVPQAVPFAKNLF